MAELEDFNVRQERRADEEREQRRVERKETIDRLFILGWGIAIGLGIAFVLVAFGVLSCPPA
jgi:hypothetical protein